MHFKNILSICNGMSCGNISLDAAGITYDNFYTSEIYNKALITEKALFPNNIQLGDVYKINYNDIPKIDLLIGGTSCQNLSIAVVNNYSHNQGLEGEKSKLFYEYLNLKKILKPKYFLLENVASMRNSDRDIISKLLEVEPVMLDSANFGAQDRKRYFWTNFPIKESPNSAKVLNDIVLDTKDVASKYWYDKDFIYNGDDAKIQCTLGINGHDILKRVHNLNNKCGTLTTCTGGNQQKKVFQNGKCRKLTPYEYGLLQNVDKDILKKMFDLEFADGHYYSLFGNGWDIKVLTHIFKSLKDIGEFNESDKSTA